MASGKKIEISLKTGIEKQAAKAGGRIPEALVNMIDKVQGFNMGQLQADSGLNWEKVINKRDPGTGLQLWSLRITGSWRALCVLHSGPVIEIRAIRNHDKSYG